MPFSSFFNIDTTLEITQPSGTLLLSIDLLYNLVIGDVNSSAAFFSTIGTIPSSPGALVGLSDISYLVTLVSSISISFSISSVSPLNMLYTFGVSSRSSSVNTDESNN